jgi:hypothetical protein
MLVSEIIARVHHALEQCGTECSRKEVVGLCPDLTWNQVFLAIDYLRQTGQVRVICDPDEKYRIQAYHGVVRVEASEA